MKILAMGYGAILLAYLIIDAVWLGIIAKGTYEQKMGFLMRDSFIAWPAILFYVTYAFGILWLVVMPNLGGTSWVPVAISGAVLGMAAYGTYNLTCYSVIKGWPMSLALTDWVWGTCLTTVTALTGWFVATKFAS